MMNNKDSYELGVVQAANECLRLSRIYSQERDYEFARMHIAEARALNAKVDACISCAERLIGLLGDNMMNDSVIKRVVKESDNESDS